MIKVTVNGDSPFQSGLVFWPQIKPGPRSSAVLRVVLVLLLFRFPVAAQRQRERREAPPDVAIVARAAQNELEALESPLEFQYCQRLQFGWGSEMLDVIETEEGQAARIVAFRDEPVTPDQALKQQRRLEKLLTDGKAARDEFAEQASEKQRRVRMMKALSRAFVFQFIGRDQNGDWMFSFRPDPTFSPKDRETEVFHGMEGTLWLQPRQERLTRIEGVLFKDVSFGWGIFGRVYKGGRYEIAQTEISPGVWRVTTLNFEFKGRTFPFEPFHALKLESDSHFHRTPAGMTYRTAVETLLEGRSQPDNARAGACFEQRNRRQN